MYIFALTQTYSQALTSGERVSEMQRKKERKKEIKKEILPFGFGKSEPSHGSFLKLLLWLLKSVNIYTKKHLEVLAWGIPLLQFLCSGRDVNPGYSDEARGCPREEFANQ